MEGPVEADSVSNGPVFVVGIVRSGTSLMSMMLSAHPAFAVAPDLHYIHHWVRRHRHLELSRPADFEEFWAAFSGNERFGYLGVDADDVRRYIEATQRFSFRGVYLSILETFAANLQKRRWGEKTPFTANHLDTLFGWFPDARVIYMLRDPRAVVSSLRKIPWLADVGVPTHARSWATGVGRALADDGDPRVLRVRYERLVHRPTDELARICRFLDEEYSPEMLTGRPALGTWALRDREGWERTHLSAALGPVHDASVERWRRELAPGEVELIEEICGPVMQQAGYSPSET
ncbi:MAG TPA: sulfotransferase [Acidimicrobiales bacterium]